MTSIFNTTGLVDNRKGRYAHPLIENDLMDIYTKTSRELSFLDLQGDEKEFNSRVSQVESELSELKDFAKSSEIDDFLDYVTNLENLVIDMAGSIITVSKGLDKLIKKADEAGMDDIHDDLVDLFNEGSTVLNCDTDLYNALCTRGWKEPEMEFIFSLSGLNGGELVQLCTEHSTAESIKLCIDDWLMISDHTCSLKSGRDSLTIAKPSGDVKIYVLEDGDDSIFHMADIRAMFINPMKPTKEEMQMYEVSHGTCYDFARWKRKFGRHIV